jgi:hypothetical protein
MSRGETGNGVKEDERLVALEGGAQPENVSLLGGELWEFGL